MKKLVKKRKPEKDYRQFSRELLGQIKNGTLSFVRQDNRVIQINISER